MDKGARVARLAWDASNGKSVGSLGPARVVLKGTAQAGRPLPSLNDLKVPEHEKVAVVYESPADMEANRPRIELVATRYMKRGGRFGQFDEPMDRALRLKVHDKAVPSPTILYPTLSEALEAALAYLDETFGVKLGA